MMQFPSLLSALSYQETCPLCSHRMDISERERDRDIATDIGYEYRENVKRISFYLTAGEEDIITINPYTEEVEININQRSRGRNMVYSGNANKTYNPGPHYTLNEKFLHSLTINCQQCCRYWYVLQVHVDLGARKIAGVFLNSENIIVEEGDVAHEIQANYAIEKTKYACFSKDSGRQIRFGEISGPYVSEKRAELPLIPINLVDPMETVARVRKLLIFS